jgi:hypothetical protein
MNLTVIMRAGSGFSRRHPAPYTTMESLRSEIPAERSTAEPHDTGFRCGTYVEEANPTGCGGGPIMLRRQIQFSEKFDPTIMRVQGSDGFWEPPHAY